MKNSHKNLKVTFVNFIENFWKVWLTNCENVKMWWNFKGNSWKFYKRENFLEIMGKLEQKFEKFLSKILSRSWLNLREKLKINWNFKKTYGNLCGKNLNKIFRKLQMNPERHLQETWNKFWIIFQEYLEKKLKICLENFRLIISNIDSYFIIMY